MSRLTPGAPLPVLMFALERAGWGDMAGQDLRGRRVVLGALSRILPAGSGSGYATAEQIAAASGYSMRWARECLWWLEEIDLLEWRRGGISEGKPMPSWFRIDKRRLLALVHLARDVREKALERLAESTRARIAGLRALTVRSRTHKRRSVHVELSASLPPVGEVSPLPAVPIPAAEVPAAATADRLEAQRLIRAATAAARTAHRTR